MRLNRDIRYQISALLAAGHQQKVIAKLIGISEGGLSKEISRNGGRKKYDPDKADKRAVKLQHKAHIHYEYSDEVWAETEALIKEDLSPEQVVGRRGWRVRKLQAFQRYTAISKAETNSSHTLGMGTRNIESGVLQRMEEAPLRDRCP